MLFPGTQGGTELGFRLDAARSDLTRANWEAGEGAVYPEGELKLDGVRLRCVADIDLATLEGTGRALVLEPQIVA